MIKKLHCLLLVFLSTIFLGNALSAQNSPAKLFNFQIENEERSKIFFESTEPIQGNSATGFVLKDKDGISITGVTINDGQLSGHYFTVSSPFKWYHNNTLYYNGGSDIQSGIPLQKFELQYIKNNIAIPTPVNKTYYVSVGGSDNNNGESEDEAFRTIQKSVNVVQPGDKVWIKAGNYGKEHIVMNSSGTENQPIHFEGYKESPGDISTMYYNYGDGDLDASEMPLIDGADRNNGIGILFNERKGNYVIRNIQIRNYFFGIKAHVANQGIVLERVIAKDFGSSSREGEGILFNTFGDNNDYNRFIDCVIINGSHGGLSFSGSNNLVENVKVYCDEVDPRSPIGLTTDYYYYIKGNNNIIRNSLADKHVNSGHDGHAFGTKYAATYNLVEHCESINILDSFMARHSQSQYNVFRDSEAHANVSYRSRGWTGGIALLAGGSYNTWNRIYVHHVKYGFFFVENTEDPGTDEVGHHNTFKNIIIDNVTTGMRLRNVEYSSAPFNNNKFYNITWNNVGTLFQIHNKNGKINFSNNEFVNNTFTNVTKLNVSSANYDAPSGFTWTNNNFYNSFEPIGDNVLTVPPNFMNPTAGDFRLNEDSELIGAGTFLEEVTDDIDKNPRIESIIFDIGAHQNQNNIPSISVDQTTCEGESVQLFASGGDSYLWTTGEETASISVSPEVTTTYSVDITNASGVTTKSVTITIVEAPIASVTEDAEICEGEFITLTAEGGDLYTWSNGETTESIEVDPSETTTYTVTVGIEGCSSTSEGTVTITVIPTPDLSAGDDVEICVGSSVTLTASGSDNYSWDTGEDTESITVSPTETTTYIVTTVSGDCTVTDEVTVTVNETPSVTASDDVTICSGTMITLTSEGEGEVVWSTGEVTKSITVNPTETTIYTVSSSNTCGTDVSDEVTVTVTATPELELNDDAIQLCEGSEVTLTATSNGAVLWSTGETSESITVSPSETTTYYATATLGDCEIEKEVRVRVVSTSELDAGPDVSICVGSSTTLSPEGEGRFTWDTGEDIRSITVNPTVTTTYTVSLETTCGEILTDEITVTVNDIPTIDAGPDMESCRENSVVLTASEADNYLWSNGETTQSITVSPNYTTTYTVRTDNGGCLAEDDVIVTIKEANVNAGSDITIDEGNNTTLTASGSGVFEWSTGETSESITVNPTVTTTYTVTITTGNGCTDSDSVVVFVTPTPEDPPVDDPPVDDPPVDDPPVDDPPVDDPPVDDPPVDDPPVDDPPVDDPPVDDPPVDNSYGFAGPDQFICKDATTILTATKGTVFLWSTGETTASITVNPTETTTYGVTVRAGEEIFSDEVIITIDEDCSGLSNRSAGRDVKIFPNPATNIINIELTGFSDQLDIAMFNLNGSKVYSEVVAKYSPVKKLIRQINVSRFAKGIYFVRLYNQGVIETKKIMII